MRQVNLENVQEAGDYTRLLAGGYVCKYTKVEDVAEKEYLYMEFDIADGEFKEYFKDLYGQGLEIANWHQNGELEPFDSFYESAIEYSLRKGDDK